MTAPRLQFRRGTAANWTSVNPTLRAGEIGIETDTKKQKVGDGATVWTGLGYQLGTAASQNTGAFDAAGAATSAQAFAIQRTNHTGSQTLATISDAGTAASKNIPTVGDATSATAQVVIPSDTQLKNVRAKALRPFSRSKTAARSALRYWVNAGDSYAYGALATEGTNSHYDEINKQAAVRWTGKTYQGNAGWKPCASALRNWANLGSGTAVSSGPGLGSYKTTANNTSIGDTTAAGTAITWFFDKYPSGTATFDAVVDGVTVVTAQSVTDGALSGGRSGYSVTVTGLTFQAHTFTLKQNGAGQVVHNGYICHNGTETKGLLDISFGIGGTLTSDWTSTGFGTALQGLLDFMTNNTTVDGVIIQAGGNDKMNSPGPLTQAASQANLKTMIQTLQAAKASLGIIVMIQPFYELPSAGVTATSSITEATWTGTWVPGYKQACIETGVLCIDQNAFFGDISHGQDPYNWSGDTGIHLGVDGNRAQAELIMDEVNLEPLAIPAVLVDGSNTMSGALNMGSQNITSAASITGTGITINAGNGSIFTTNIFGIPVIEIKALVADANPTFYIASNGFSMGPSTGTSDVNFNRSAAGVWTMGSNTIIIGNGTAATHATNLRQTTGISYALNRGLY